MTGTSSRPYFSDSDADLGDLFRHTDGTVYRVTQIATLYNTPEDWGDSEDRLELEALLTGETVSYTRKDFRPDVFHKIHKSELLVALNEHFDQVYRPVLGEPNDSDPKTESLPTPTEALMLGLMTYLTFASCDTVAQGFAVVSVICLITFVGLLIRHLLPGENE